MTKLVKMVRAEDGKTADVHPDMVDDYKAGGFAEVADEKPRRGRRKAAD